MKDHPVKDIAVEREARFGSRVEPILRATVGGLSAPVKENGMVRAVFRQTGP